MVRLDVIKERIQALEDYALTLRGFQGIDIEGIRTDREKLWAIEHGLQLAIECLLDIGEHLIASLQLGRPKERSDVIEILGEKGVIPPDFVKRAKGMVGFRNILVHEYLRVDPGEVHANLQKGPDEFEGFISYIVAFLRAQGIDM